MGVQLEGVGVSVELVDIEEGDPADLDESEVRSIRKELGFGA